jgi:hypothetical protein
MMLSLFTLMLSQTFLQVSVYTCTDRYVLGVLEWRHYCHDVVYRYLLVTLCLVPCSPISGKAKIVM